MLVRQQIPGAGPKVPVHTAELCSVRDRPEQRRWRARPVGGHDHVELVSHVRLLDRRPDGDQSDNEQRAP